MKLIFESWRKFLKDGIENGVHDGKYYAFDWDDNVVHMPSKIMLITDKGEEVGMSTAGFAEYREQVGKEPFKYGGNTIVDFAEEPFRNFRVEGDAQFLADLQSAKPGPSWDALRECINGGSIFAIITARGHSPDTFRKAVRYFINNSINGISKEALVESLKKYIELETEEGDRRRSMTGEQLVDRYLVRLCKFYPVSHESLGGEGGASGPEELKGRYMGEFKGHVEKVHGKLSSGAEYQLGFSDDDLVNVRYMQETHPDVISKYTGPRPEETDLLKKFKTIGSGLDPEEQTEENTKIIERLLKEEIVGLLASLKEKLDIRALEVPPDLKNQLARAKVARAYKLLKTRLDELDKSFRDQAEREEPTEEELDKMEYSEESAFEFRMAEASELRDVARAYGRLSISTGLMFKLLRNAENAIEFIKKRPGKYPALEARWPSSTNR